MSDPRALRYEPYESLDGRPHVMVDGACRPGSVLTLSHWPQSPTPRLLARDVSAAIVLQYLRCRPSPPGRRRRSGALERELQTALAAGAAAEAVTNDHFDEDGLMSVFALVEPAAALERDELVEDVATCGDFGVVRSRAAAAVAFAIDALADEEAGAEAGTSERYGAVLPRVTELLEHPERFGRYSAEALAGFDEGRRAIEGGEVVVTEAVGADLAVVERSSRSDRRLPGAAGGMPVHPAAVHSATAASRILAIDGSFCELYLRYEGWVRTVSRHVPLRPDLEPLAELLAAEEPSGIRWEADSVGAIVPRLHPASDGRTEIEPSRLVEVVGDYLMRAEPAWDPFREASAYIPLGERLGYSSGYGER